MKNLKTWQVGILLAGLTSIASAQAAPAKAPLKERLHRGEVCTGAFLGLLASGPAAMFLAGQGMDYFILDKEHYTFDDIQVREMITAARYSGIAPIIRVGEPTQEITRWLDAGAEGIIIPSVETRQQAEALVRLGRYAPEGERGASSVNSHTGFSKPADLPKFLADRNRDIILMVMIETPKGFANLEEILSVPGIDGAIIGTGDYTQAIGLAGQADHPKAWEAADKLIAACRAKKKLVSVPIRKPENVAHWVKAGLNMLTFVDISMISQGIQLNFEQVKAAKGAIAPTPARDGGGGGRGKDGGGGCGTTGLEVFLVIALLRGLRRRSP
jgi:2-keto-3-deoxy-L-rhamnonate aldolase RhmA